MYGPMGRGEDAALRVAREGRAEAEREVERLKVERDAAVASRDAAIAERDAAVAEAEAYAVRLGFAEAALMEIRDGEQTVAEAWHEYIERLKRSAADTLAAVRSAAGLGPEI